MFFVKRFSRHRQTVQPTTRPARSVAWHRNLLQSFDRLNGSIKDLVRRGRDQFDSPRRPSCLLHHTLHTPVMPFRRSEVPKKARHALGQASTSYHSCRRHQQVLGEGYPSGKSCQRVPLRKLHIAQWGRPQRLYFSTLSIGYFIHTDGRRVLKSTCQEETEKRSKKPKTWRLRDPVHGLIGFGNGGNTFQNETDAIALELIDTPEFQRLRRIRQLGLSDLVYPGATHTRFAHSIGVYHIARQLIEVIRRDISSEFDEERARVALLAALLHDIGHGPFSHVFEDLFDHTKLCLSRNELADSDLTNFAKEKHKKFKGSHEVRSAEIIKSNYTQVNKVLCRTCKDLPGHIAATLTAEPSDIYARIVSSSFDADRLDYLQRDRMMTGVECGHIDFAWLLDSLTVEEIHIDGGDSGIKKVPCLCLTSKGRMVAEEYLEARFRLWKTVYMHKTTKAAEAMLRRLFFFAAKDLNRRTRLAKERPILNYLTSKTPELDIFLKLDDAQVWAALEALDSTKNCQVVELSHRLLNRDLYKVVNIEGDASTRILAIYQKFTERYPEDIVAKENASVLFYDRVYAFGASATHKKILIKKSATSIPADIAADSPSIQALEQQHNIWRIYMSDDRRKDNLNELTGA